MLPRKKHTHAQCSQVLPLFLDFIFSLSTADFLIFSWCQRASKSWSVLTLLKVWKAGVVIVWK